MIPGKVIDVQGRRPLWARCISLTADDRPCWRRVRVRGARCDRCWTGLATSPRVSHRLELAAEPVLPAWVAAQLADDPEPMVRIVLAGRRDLAATVVARLGRDQDPAVRRAVLGPPAGNS